jgi:hypothetical protein
MFMAVSMHLSPCYDECAPQFLNCLQNHRVALLKAVSLSPAPDLYRLDQMPENLLGINVGDDISEQVLALILEEDGTL